MPAPRDTDTGGARKRRRREAASRKRTRSQARAQERQYGSQGRAVERVARQRSRPKAGPPSPKPLARALGPRQFEPFVGNKGLAKQRERARAKSRRAEQRLGDNPNIPHIPLLSSGYSRRQRQSIRDIYKRAAKRAGYDSTEEMYRSGSPRQRAQMRRVGRVMIFGPGSYRSTAQAQRRQVAYNLRNRVAPKEPGPNLLGKVARSGFLLLPGGQQQRRFAESAGATVYNVGRATLEDPGAVAGTSLRVARESIAGIPQGIKQMAEDPVRAIEMIVEDYEQRYGSVLDDPEAFRERVKTEWGLTPYVLDVAAAASVTGRGVALAARSERFGRAAAALSQARQAPPGTRAAGRVAERLHRTATSERPALRFSGGAEGVRPQRRSRNMWVALGQDALDRRRARVLEADDSGRALNQRVRQGEVTPITRGVIGRSLRETPLLRRYTGRVARNLGGRQSTARIRMLTQQGRITSEMRKRIGKLDKREKLAVREMGELGVRAGPQGIRALENRLARLEADGHGDSADAAAIREILANPGLHVTPRAGRIIDELREIQLRESGRDPRLVPEQEIIRRLTPQADLLSEGRRPDVEYFRGVLRDIEAETGARGLAQFADKLAKAHPSERRSMAAQLVKDIRSQRRAAERDVETARRRLAVAETEARKGPAVTTPQVREARRELARLQRERTNLRGELRGRRGEGYTVRGVRDGRTFRIDALRDRLSRLDIEIAAARTRVREAEAEAPRMSDVQAQRIQRRQLELAARRSTRDHVRGFEKALVQVLRASKKKEHMRLEDAQSFAERVSKAADEAGLAEPLYWKGILEGELDDQPGLKAVGRGLRGTNKPKATEYKLTRSGRGERDPEVLIRGVEANIKRRFQYELVLGNIDAHAFEWSRGPANAGLTVDQLRWHMRRHGIDPASVELLDTRILGRRNMDPDTLDEDLVSTDLDELRAARISGRDIMRSDYRDLAQNRYVAFPREVGETLDGLANRMDSTGFRALEVILKQKPARLMLGALNVPWLAFQVASNTLLTGLGGGLNPFDIYGAHKWWRGLDDDAKAAIEAELGITHGHHFGMDQPNLGATNNRMVAFWRGYKASKVGRLAHRMNPLDAMFRVDEAQNNFFRRTLFYSKARKAAYRRMGRDWKGIDRGITRLSDRVLAKDPDRIGQAIAQHGHEFEQVASHVKSFLGDYVSFTPAERFLLSRNVMFYGYLRFSLRFVFYTMPVGHPVMTAILSDIGRMGAQEIKRLFGVPADYNLPTSMLAQTYFGTRQDAKRGTLRSINFGRMNPFLNAVTQMEDANQSLGLVSPIYQAVADQFFEESSFTGRDWRIEGRPTPSEAERPRNYYNNEARARIFGNQMLSLLYPYRAASDVLMEPNQSDDALLFSQQPMRYKDEEAMRGVAKSRRQFRETPIGERILRNLVPVLSKPTAAPQVIAREREKEADMENRRTGRRRPRRRARYGGSSGSRYGGGGGSRYGG